MRYYVFAVQYNKDKDAENRTIPKAYDKLNDAVREFHAQLSKDMGNETLGWSLCMVINSEGGVHRTEKWKREEEPVVEEEAPVEE